jgi:hypothetical protein
VFPPHKKNATTVQSAKTTDTARSATMRVSWLPTTIAEKAVFVGMKERASFGRLRVSSIAMWIAKIAAIVSCWGIAHANP